MLDKELIKNNFKKSIKTYNSNAIVQKKVAQKLVSFLPLKKFPKILEIGSYSGLLTKELINWVEFKQYLAIDIIDSFDEIKKLDNRIKFQIADVEDIEFNEKFDLIIASSSLQWCSDFEGVVKKLKSHLSNNGVVAISVFGKDNLFEIKKVFGAGLNYKSVSELKFLFSDNAKIIEETQVLEFQNPKDILKHLKYTGVNSIRKNTLGICEIRKKLKMLNDIYENKLTYNPIYIID